MSDPILDEAETTYLRTLKENPIWNRILNKISAYEKLPRYSPKPKANNNEQHGLWIYRSGGQDATDGIVSLLSQNTIGVKDG